MQLNLSQVNMHAVLTVCTCHNIIVSKINKHYSPDKTTETMHIHYILCKIILVLLSYLKM